MKVQSLIFSKKIFKTVEAAKAWAKKNGFKHGDVDETGTSFRLRQFDPGKATVFRNTPMTEGVTGVMARNRMVKAARRYRDAKMRRAA